MRKLTTLITACVLLFATTAGAVENPLADLALREAGADYPPGSCIGTLVHMKEGYFLLGDNFKNLCLFNNTVPSYLKTVLKGCKVGKKCEIFGAVARCADDREYDQCIAVIGIKKAHIRKGAPHGIEDVLTNP